MACDEGHEWLETSIAGLQVRAEGAAEMRVLGWEGVVPLSVIRAVVECAEPAASSLAAPPAVLPGVRGSQHTQGRPPARHRLRPRPSPDGWGRNAETIRQILRRAGCTEFSDTEDGFVVDHGPDEEQLRVVCTIGHGTVVQRELRRYRQALTQAGIQVVRNSKDRNSLLVWTPDTTA